MVRKTARVVPESARAGREDELYRALGGALIYLRRWMQVGVEQSDSCTATWVTARGFV
ncbi:MAG: hypothetical protein NVSMB42_26600 [Herpetosiphon sp.]